MRPFKNNQKRNRNRSLHERPFKRSNDINRLNPEFGNRENGFRRKNNRNNGNVEKLISKYNELAREALSNGDKILSENKQHYKDAGMAGIKRFLKVPLDAKIPTDVDTASSHHFQASCMV